jgi:hypothetical protein
MSKKEKGRAMLIVACLAVAWSGTTYARTPLGDAAQALINPSDSLRFVTYGETELAPAKIFRDTTRTYIQLGKETSQRVDVLEVTPIGYRRLPAHYSAPYLVIAGFVPSLALSYPGRNLVFVEFAPEALRQPASEAELALRMQERSQALLQRQTRLETAERDVYDRARNERARTEESATVAQQRLAAADQAIEQARVERAKAMADMAQAEEDRRQAQADRRQAEAERNAAAAARDAVSRRPARAFDVYRTDGQLRNVLTRWARNDGLDLVWEAPDDERHNPEVAADGPVDATTLKEAMKKLLEAFRGNGVELQATFYSDGIVEISKKGER